MRKTEKREEELSKETVVILLLTVISAVCLLGLVLVFAHAHDLEEINAKLVSEAAYTDDAQTPAAEVGVAIEPSSGAPAIATIGVRDVRDPGKSGIFDREGKVKFLNLTEALEDLGISEISITEEAEGSYTIIGTLPGSSDENAELRLKTQWVEDDEPRVDETCLLSAEVIYGERSIKLAREERVIISEEALTPSLEAEADESSLVPVILWKDDMKTGAMISERQLDCLKWVLVNQVPTDIEYVEDVLFQTPLKKAPAD